MDGNNDYGVSHYGFDQYDNDAYDWFLKAPDSDPVLGPNPVLDLDSALYPDPVLENADDILAGGNNNLDVTPSTLLEGLSMGENSDSSPQGATDAAHQDQGLIFPQVPDAAIDPALHGQDLTFPQVPDAIDPAILDSGLAFPAPQETHAPQPPQMPDVNAGPVLQDPVLAHVPQVFESQDFLGQVNDANQAETGLGAYGDVYGYGSAAYGQPSAPNGIQPNTYQGIQMQHPQATHDASYIPNNAYPAMGQFYVPAGQNPYQVQFANAGQPLQLNHGVPPHQAAPLQQAVQFNQGLPPAQPVQFNQAAPVNQPIHYGRFVPIHQLNQPVQFHQVAQPNQPAQQTRQPASPDHAGRKRRRGSPGFDPAAHYPNRPVLGPWGPPVGRNGRQEQTFRYYQQTAELKHGLTFTKDQLVQFFFGNGHPNPARNLTLWVQNTPAQSNDRYVKGGASAKCRYADCEEPQNTIQKGFWRVAFDEFSDRTGTEFDPFHNAGYMHLHCFETVFDLGHLMHYGAARHGFKIEPDTRNFLKEGRNPMSVVRDTRRILDAYNAWKDGQKARADQLEARNAGLSPNQQYTGFDPAPDAILPHIQRLGCALTQMHVDCEAAGRARTRQRRGGVHIEIHMGDLTKYVRLKREKREGGGSLEPSPSAERRGADDDEEEEEVDARSPSPLKKGKKRAVDDDDDDDDYAEAGRSTAKRQRVTGPPPRVRNNARATPEADTIYVATSPYRPPPNPPRPRPNPTLNVPGRVTRKRAREAADGEQDQQDPQQLPEEGSTRAPKRARPHTAAADAIVAQPSQQQNNLHANPNPNLVPHIVLTRQAAATIQSRLGEQPEQVRHQILAAVPAAYQPLIVPPTGPVRNDRLAERISRLDRRQRRAVEDAVRKQERVEEVVAEGGGKQRKVQSL